MFYIVINGIVNNHNFSYLEGGPDNRARLDKTLAHASLKEDSVCQNKQKYAIEFMVKNVITANDDDRLSDIFSSMHKHGIRHIPVIRGDSIIGMLSLKDLLSLKESAGFNFIKAKEVMSSVVVCADEECSFRNLAKVMVKENISALPILNSQKMLVGIVSYVDLLKVVIDTGLAI